MDYNVKELICKDFFIFLYIRLKEEIKLEI